ncbi:hypothetical protein C8J56DRAFT_1050392 [Mycena floridula]|nr:hypothetical protein C8J56DRAFT_1050392 [Mycena floridula]
MAGGIMYSQPHLSCTQTKHHSAQLGAEKNIVNVLGTLNIDTDATDLRITNAYPVDNTSNFRPWFIGTLDFTSFDELNKAWDAMAAAHGTIRTPAGAWLSLAACSNTGSTKLNLKKANVVAA